MPYHNQLAGVFIGEESLLIQCATAWLEAGHTVTAVVSSVPNIVAWAESQ
ncbi:MAG: hypothetical protein F6K62_26760, partial [Sphaerospermopsis sp. SIO1G2]|nr:hypothetical protein [Sphaerospermopsis sp. SIO1G2]